MVRKGKDWFPNDKATHEWLDSLKKSSRATYQTGWKYFLEYTKMTGDQILADRKKDEAYNWEKRVLDFKRWMIDVKDKAETTATTTAATTRSFFAYHRVGLEFRPTEKRRLKEARAKYEDYRFSREDLAKMASVANLTEKYVLVAGKSFGLRAGDFLALTRGDLEAYIDREPPISIGEYTTQKESVKAYPFIDSDAKPVIKMMLEKMNREGRIGPNERILEYTNTIQLSRIIRRLTKRAGINIGNKRVRFHCLRKFLCDRLSDVMSESKWKQVVGKAVDEKAYVSPDLLRKDYERAMAETCFTKPKGEGGRRKAFEDMVKAMFPEYYPQIKQAMDKEPDTDKAIEVGQEVIAKIETEGIIRIGRTENNGDCQKVVSEAELSECLRQGWRFVATLPSGKVVVSNEKR